MDCTITLKDSKSRLTRKMVEINEATIALAITALDAYLADLNAVTDLEFVSAQLTVPIANASLVNTFAGVANSNIDSGATFRVQLPDGKRAGHHIPGFPSSLVGSDGQINVAGAEVVAYFANFDGTTNTLELSDGETVDSVEKGQWDK